MGIGGNGHQSGSTGAAATSHSNAVATVKIEEAYLGHFDKLVSQTNDWRGAEI